MTDHLRRRLQQKGITEDAVALACQLCRDPEYDQINNSYKLSEWVAGGQLCVAIEARAFDSRGQHVVKTAYWRVQAPPA